MSRQLACGAFAVGLFALAAPSGAQAPAAAPETHKIQNATFHRIVGDTAVFFRRTGGSGQAMGFAVDADGAPHAYAPDFTCEGSNTAWKLPANIGQCSAHAVEKCDHVKGFVGNPAAGEHADYVTCATVKVDHKWTCCDAHEGQCRAAPVHRTQGGCTLHENSDPAKRGFDSLPAAGNPGNWWAVVPKNAIKPAVQGPNDPAPGFYVSGTAYGDPAYPEGSQRRYVDSERINYIALPAHIAQLGVHLGDYAMVINWKTGKLSGAVFADTYVGDHGEHGEGSISLAKQIGIHGDARGHGARSEDVVYVLFPGTKKAFPRDNDQLVLESVRLFVAWGGIPKLKATMPAWASTYAHE